MATNKCPRCKSPCIIKVVAESSEEWREVDVCKMCGSMYPRGKIIKSTKRKGAAVKKKPKKAKSAPKARSKVAKKAASKKKPVKKRKTR